MSVSLGKTSSFPNIIVFCSCDDVDAVLVLREPSESQVSRAGSRVCRLFGDAFSAAFSSNVVCRFNSLVLRVMAFSIASMLIPSPTNETLHRNDFILVSILATCVSIVFLQLSVFMKSNSSQSISAPRSSSWLVTLMGCSRSSSDVRVGGWLGTSVSLMPVPLMIGDSMYRSSDSLYDPVELLSISVIDDRLVLGAGVRGSVVVLLRGCAPLLRSLVLTGVVDSS